MPDVTEYTESCRTTVLMPVNALFAQDRERFTVTPPCLTFA